MSNKVKVPGGAFYAGDGLTIDPVTRTVSAGGVQSDWNQNDSAAADYVKNRPFYTGDPVETVLQEETAITIAGMDNLVSSSFPYSFKVGQTYVITFDGVNTEYTACEQDGHVFVGGDYSSVVGGSGYFLWVFNGNLILTTKDKSLFGSHTIAIKEYAPEIIRIDEKYIPELPYMDKANPTGTGSFTLNRKANTTVGNYSFAEGYMTTASGNTSHAEGSNTTASGDYSHAEGQYTKASSRNQHVQGKYNVEDTNNVYADIVGNGTSNSSRSNAYTLDWNGNGWFAGTVESNAIILRSSTTDSSKRFKITVDDSGKISATEVTV